MLPANVFEYFFRIHKAAPPHLVEQMEKSLLECVKAQNKAENAEWSLLVNLFKVKGNERKYNLD